MRQGIRDTVALGPLEQELLEILWKKKKARVRELYEFLEGKRELAHSSVAVLLDRLYKKGLVTREIETCRGGFRYLYRPSHKKQEFQKIAVETAVNKLIKKFGSVAVNYFDEKFNGKQ